MDAVNIIKKERKINDQGNQTINKRELPLFMLTFDNQEKTENIYNIKSILSMKVKIEPLRKTTNRIPQCKRCQSYNHTQAYCSRELRCVKCAGKHLTSTCTIKKNTPPKCVNCKGQYPANYHGCEVAKELQKIRNQERKPKQIREKPTERKQILNQEKPKLLDKETGDQKSYAQIVEQTEPERLKENKDNKIFEEILKSLEI